MPQHAAFLRQAWAEADESDQDRTTRGPSAGLATSDARFFIVGAGRSGTTLLRLILCGHSRLHVVPETWFVHDLTQRLPLTGPLTAAQIETALHMMTAHYRWPDLDFPTAALQAEASRLHSPDLRALIDLVYVRQAVASGKPRIGDKTPPYVQCLPALATLYPEARFIHLLRDGRDVALSYIEAGWPQRCYEGEQFEWTRAVRLAAAFADQSRILHVRYENLVADPEAEIARVCAFLGEAFEPGMLAFSRQADLVPIRERRIHQRLTGPLDDRAVGAWRTRLTAGQCFVIESCLWRDLLGSGYRLRYAEKRWRPFLRFSGAVLSAARPILLRLVPALQRRGFLTGY